MNTVFLYCAAIGGGLLVLQLVLLLLGAGGDSDVDLDAGGVDHAGAATGHDQGSFLKLFSIQTVVTFATFFGLTGLATEPLGWSPTAVAVAAVAAGAAALFAVARAMSALQRLQSSGSLDLRNAVGRPGTCYLRIPAAGQGHGRVQLIVQGRHVECRAVSRGAEIPTGAPVHVIEHQAGDTLVVDQRR